nr:hypothetical protein [Tanacetum cinerariifolium]
MNSPPNYEWEQVLDIDDYDLRLTPIIRSNNNPHILLDITNTTQTLFSSQNHHVHNYVVKAIRIVPGPAGIVQTAKLRKIADTREGREESVMSMQDVVEYVNVDGGIVTGCFGDVKKFLKNGKLKKVVAIIMYCTLNALADLTALTVGAALILYNVSVFSPKQSTHRYLNITKKNIVKVLHKDGGSS